MPWRLPRESTRTARPPLIPGRRDPRPTIPVEPERETYFLDSARYQVRWESARPVREAFARLKTLGEAATANFQSPPPSVPENQYIVTVKTVRPPKAGREPFERAGDRALRAAARLKAQAGEVQAVKVERSGLGANAAVHFFFPRTAGTAPFVGAGGERVEFTVELRHIRLKSKFRVEPEWLR